MNNELTIGAACAICRIRAAPSTVLKHWITKSARHKFVNCSIGITTEDAIREGANRGSTDRSRGEAHRTVDSPRNGRIGCVCCGVAPAAHGGCRYGMPAACRPSVVSVDTRFVGGRRGRCGGGPADAWRWWTQVRIPGATAVASPRRRWTRSAHRDVARVERGVDALCSRYDCAGDSERGYVSAVAVTDAVRNVSGGHANTSAVVQRSAGREQQQRYRRVRRSNCAGSGHRCAESHP